MIFIRVATLEGLSKKAESGDPGGGVGKRADKSWNLRVEHIVGRGDKGRMAKVFLAICSEHRRFIPVLNPLHPAALTATPLS